MKNNGTLTYKGIEYKNVRQCCIINGKTTKKEYNTVMRRIKRGYTLEEAMEKESKVKDHVGNEFNSVEEMCKHYGVSKSTYYNRVNSGITKEKALKMGGRNRSR